MLRLARWSMAILLSVSFAAQAPAQRADRETDSLLAHAERGDAVARHRVEPLAWGFVKQVATTGRLDAVTARTMARAMLIMEGPLPPLDRPPEEKERIWRSAAVNALEMALAQDSGDVWSAEQLERIAPYPYIWMDPDKQLIALRALLRRHPDLPADLLLTRVRLELERGSADSAGAWLAILPAGAVSEAARGHLTAEVLFAQRHDSAASVAYYDGAAAIRDAADAAWYQRDLAWIAQPEELDEWRRIAPSARESFLEKFWNRRDLDDGRLPGTRLPEQFRRWRIALRDYRWEYDGSTARGMIIPAVDGVTIGDGRTEHLFPKDSTISDLAYWSRQRPLSLVLDDRGGLTLRHGEGKVVNLPGIEGRFEATMRWDTPDGPLIVGFSRLQFHKTAFDSTETSMRFGMIARNYPVGDLTAICAVDSRLCLLDAMVEKAPPRVQLVPPDNSALLAYADPIRADYGRMRESAEHTDGNPETFADDLHAIVQAYGIPDVGTLVVFAIPVRALERDAARRAASRDYAARLRVIVGDSSQGVIAGALDTLRQWHVGAPAATTTQLTGYAIVPAASGTWGVSVVLSDLVRRAGTGLRINGVPVAAFDGTKLRLSDLIIGSDSSGLAWNHGGIRIPLNPRNAWRPDEPAVLSYQLDGLVPGRRYETRIEIWDAAGTPKTFRNAIEFTTSASQASITIRRDLTLSQLAPASYRVVLQVRDSVTGAEVTRERKITVSE